MVDGQFFDTLEEIARYVRRDVRPFGGIQLVVCGAPVLYPMPLLFCQAVSSNRHLYPDSVNRQKLPISFADDAKKWSTCIREMITLTKVCRQQEGGRLVLHKVATF